MKKIFLVLGNKKKKNGKYILRPDCKECEIKRTREYRISHKEKCKQYHQKYDALIRNNYCITGKETEIENYELAKADNFINWERHHSLETHNSDGEKRLVQITKQELVALGMYFDRPPEELLWVKVGEHRKLHKKYK